MLQQASIQCVSAAIAVPGSCLCWAFVTNPMFNWRPFAFVATCVWSMRATDIACATFLFEVLASGGYTVEDKARGVFCALTLMARFSEMHAPTHLQCCVLSCFSCLILGDSYFFMPLRITGAVFSSYQVWDGGDQPNYA